MILSCNHISKAFGTDVILNDISFHIEDFEKAAIVGINGAGKTTLLRIIVGELSPDQGDAVLSKGKTLGYLAQDLTAEELAGSVYDFCAACPAFFDLTPNELGEIARQLRFPAEEFYGDRPVSTLSGGERIKLQLGRLLFQRPQALLLDEPSSDVDLETLTWLEAFIGGFPGIALFFKLLWVYPFLRLLVSL